MNARRMITLLAFTAGLSTAAFAQEMTPEQQAETRTKVQTAMALANIAMAEKDGQALMVAARMLASAGDVAKPGEKMTDGKPTLVNVDEMMKAATEMGATPAAAETARAVKPSSGYWYYSCDSYNNCQWIYAGY